MNALSQKVSMAEKIGYSLGDCSANLVFQMMMIYQTKFYTDVFGLEGAIAGSVMLIARIVDAFVDPTVGILSDRTQTKWGKYRPWVLWTALPFMVFYGTFPLHHAHKGGEQNNDVHVIHRRPCKDQLRNALLSAVAFVHEPDHPRHHHRRGDRRQHRTQDRRL